VLGQFLEHMQVPATNHFLPPQMHAVRGKTRGTLRTPASALDISILMVTFANEARLHPQFFYILSCPSSVDPAVLVKRDFSARDNARFRYSRPLVPSSPLTSMSQVLRFNSTDPRIMYGGQWATNWRQNGTSSSATQGAQFFLLFRGEFIHNGFVVYFSFS